jgi:phosphoribosylformimino-5-aminoimidazole carboxamide ribotide isomerase
MKFTIYPAIDLRRGSVVRLKLGDPAKQTTFSDNPQQMALKWVDAGAKWLHVVNLDGAFAEGSSANLSALEKIVTSGARVQFGGGLRSFEDAARVFDLGAARVVLGTAAADHPQLVADLVARYGPEKIAVGIDALHGQVRIHGWKDDTQLTPEQSALRMRALGVTRLIYTDISRDGVLSGVNAAATAQLAQASGMSVTASGGVASLDDVRAAVDEAQSGVDGLIIGRTLYDGRISLQDALATAGRLIETQMESD